MSMDERDGDLRLDRRGIVGVRNNGGGGGGGGSDGAASGGPPD